jgi:Ni/Co efflux regulator RcnB
MRRLFLALTEEDSMKKFGYIIAALGVFAIAAPSIASAQDVGRDRVRVDAREHRGEFREHRAEFREHRDRGWHRHHDKVVIIKHRHHDY